MMYKSFADFLDDKTDYVCLNGSVYFVAGTLKRNFQNTSLDILIFSKTLHGKGA